MNFHNPIHPYTKALINAIPIADLKYRNKKREIITGEVPSPIEPEPGCRFIQRCPYADEGCKEGELEFREIRPDHFVLCKKANQILGQ